MKLGELLDLLSDEAFDKDLEVVTDHEDHGLQIVTGVAQGNLVIIQTTHPCVFKNISSNASSEEYEEAVRNGIMLRKRLNAIKK